MSELYDTLAISAMGMKAQGARIRVISENLANSDTAATSPEGKPYQRQIITFKNTLDRELGLDIVKVDQIKPDTSSDFKMKFMPDHPGADKNGYVKMPNVNTLIEVMDMREAQRTYEANLGMIEQARGMLMRTIDLLRG
ncbi:MAG: flagellar basal body rod protein FlgC [Alphaproteobacteria bacterium]|nr:flagellar basal body rod protein FlgC [Alphaproteobacteria bacterium]